MTAASETPARGTTTGLRRLLSSMWGFWFLLLLISLGAAAAIYYLWLQGRV